MLSTLSGYCSRHNTLTAKPTVCPCLVPAFWEGFWSPHLLQFLNQFKVLPLRSHIITVQPTKNKSSSDVEKLIKKNVHLMKKINTIYVSLNIFKQLAIHPSQIQHCKLSLRMSGIQAFSLFCIHNISCFDSLLGEKKKWKFKNRCN